jgi:enterochelin esterase-like enzyme
MVVLVLTACNGRLTVTLPSPIPAALGLEDSETTASKITPESAIPDPTQSPIPSISVISTPAACLENHGSVEEFSITRRDQEITGRIYTPPCYSSFPDLKYPSLYLLHGATETDQQWEDLGVFGLADELITKDVISPLIIVLPREKSWIPLPDNPFGDQLVKDLIPWVDGTYQTIPAREYRAIGGLSRGGNWAVRLGFLHWGIFGSVGAHSTPLFIGDLERIAGWIEAIPGSKIPRIYLDIGADDNDLQDAVAFEEQMLQLNIPHTWHLYPGSHTESYWQDHLEDYLLWYSSGWQEAIQ